MKKVGCFLLAAMASCSSFAADIPESCLKLQEKLSQQIQGNGVAVQDFKLDIVESEQGNTSTGKVIGDCSAGRYQIIYTRGNNINPAASAVETLPAAEEPQAAIVPPPDNDIPHIPDPDARR